MTPDQAKAFLAALGSPAEYQGGDWVKAKCPLAKFLHQHKQDNNPSFGLTVKEGKHSHFNCFACISGSAEELVQTLEMYTQQHPELASKYNFKAARALLEQEALEVFPLPEFTEFGDDDSKEFQEWPQWYLETFDSWDLSIKASAYLDQRGVPSWQREQHDLRYDPNRQMVLFPFHSVYGKLAGARGRCINPALLSHYDFTWNKVNNTGLVWYNEQVLNAEEPVVIVEGQFDCLTVERAYPHVMANLTARPSLPKLKKLDQCPGVILMLDNDATGKLALISYIAYCQKRGIPYIEAPLPEGIKDPDQLGTDGVRQLLIKLGLDLK